MSAAGILPRLEAWAQEEIGVQQRLLVALAAHEEALGRGRPDAIESTLRDVDGADTRGTVRRTELDRLLRELATEWDLAGPALSLGSVAERFGERGARLARMRNELREALLEVRARARRVALVARQQRGVVLQVLESVLGKDGLEGIRGVIVDSRA